ncbi:ABC transporter substrate-binding protein [Arthrobacter sp. I2-34]|uniref:ABC transporter substrate-binding protein n=1 Tax=Arthrobacter hankyongi TaxID=2904801 RepID=A0ABS9L5N6_9MICC|nr:ABC transporter substrate-binding protein [Arthrobacter hankyongi]MCG2621990.1 ABC transporter substrate-binding protein [Arthrobacter hankyongi]
MPPVPYLLAAEFGLLDGVEATRTTSSGAQLEALITGQQDIAVTAIDNLFEWTKAGADLRLVAQIEQTTPVGVYARGDVESVADLAGCRFAVDALANGFALIARRMLRDAGVEVDYVEAGGVRERFEALLAGEADASLLGPPFGELAAQAGMRCVASVNELLPELPGQGLVVRTQMVDSDALHAYLRALVRGAEIGVSLPDDDGIALLERCGFKAAAAAAWAARPRTLAVQRSGLALLTDIRRSLEVLPRDIGLADLWDAEPLRRAV